jgi:NAD(P)-dependent dehydrogenase (short-subunit alcohol dehydrogenase family)
MVRYLKGVSDRHPAAEETTMQRFIDKVILIAGAAEGVGRAIALAFAKEGAIIVPTDVNAELLTKTAKEASQLSGRPVDWFKIDVTKKGGYLQATSMPLADSIAHLLRSRALVKPPTPLLPFSIP